MNEFSTYFELLPLPAGWWLSIAVIAVMLFCLLGWKLRELLLSRFLVAAAFILLAASPYITRYTLAPLNPVALIVVDQSASMQLGDRPEQSRRMLAWLQKELRTNEELEVERFDLGTDNSSETHIFSALMPIIAQYDSRRIAAIFLITDGQIADANNVTWPEDGPPLHILLAGQQHEQQAYLEIAPAPPYAMTGSTIRQRIKAHWNNSKNAYAETILSIHSDQRRWQQKIPLNEWTALNLPIEHTGQNRFVLSLPSMDGAVFPAAQTAVIDIPAVQDKMDVLWQKNSGNLPYEMGAFLRSPLINLKQSPFRQQDLSSYDLIVLSEPLAQPHPIEWEKQLADYLRGGGRVLLIQSQATAATLSPALTEILPMRWSEVSAASEMKSTENGLTHPVTAELVNQLEGILSKSNVRIDTASNSKILLKNTQGSDLLILSENGNGRLAAVTDEALLQQPASPALLRNIFHWLLRDPAMSDRAISVRADKDEVRIEYLSDNPAIRALQITRPDRTKFELPLSIQDSGFNTASFTPYQVGVYLISDGVHETSYVHGNAMVPEFTMATATPARLSPLVAKTNGSILWIDETPTPALRWVTSRQRGGRDWLPLRETHANVSTGAIIYPLLPKFVLLVLIGAALGYAWWRESR